ncbi:Uracil-DNA glycosylase [Giardia muris]|uniref:Uracil-DNA glycosylase n=1 Tax=Giardia muris TaxID=5742 RepID=A0A4Z1T8C0_GIAMU|nr:Uracil-DNA glycosylase [Giardia muris]|eukprot:TNJ28839.1 Uracil-DNA glycosylase [Giardia muris]
MKSELRCDWPNVQKILGNLLQLPAFTPSPKNNLLPRNPSQVFRALNVVGDPSNVRLVIVGQDPYPRPASAVGLSFLDGAITSFQDPRLAPSLRNIIKAIFISRGLMTQDGTVQKVRDLCREHLPDSPQDWALNLSENCGVLWLNRSLTFESKEPEVLKKHVTFWDPVLRKIIDEIVMARKAINKGVVFILWGNKAAELIPVINKAASKVNLKNVKILRNIHPVLDEFPSKGVFQTLKEMEESIGIGVTDFLKCLVDETS